MQAHDPPNVNDGSVELAFAGQPADQAFTHVQECGGFLDREPVAGRRQGLDVIIPRRGGWRRGRA